MRSQAGVSHADIQVHFVPTQVKEHSIDIIRKNVQSKVIPSVDNMFL